MYAEIVNIAFSHLMEALAILIIVYEVYKKLKEIKKTSDEGHDWEMRIKKAVETVEKKEAEWDEALTQVRETRAIMTKEFNKRLDEIENKIEENHTDTEAKIQEVRAEQMFQMELFKAVLDGLGQLGSNGPVTEMKEKLDKYLIDKAYE